MMPQDILLLAIPGQIPLSLPQPRDLDGVGGILYRSQSGGLNLRIEALRDAERQTASDRLLPRRLRRLSGYGIIEGRYGWFRSAHILPFTDWTIYGRTSLSEDSCSDLFVLTQDFVAHGQHDLSGAPIHPQIKISRYGAPLHQLDGEAFMLPIYLRSSLVPPKSAHERIKQVDRYGDQINIILDLLGLRVSKTPELTWLHRRNYE